MEESLSEGLATLGWPAGMPMGGWLKGTDMGRSSPLWAASFPGQGGPEL